MEHGAGLHVDDKRIVGGLRLRRPTAILLGGIILGIGLSTIPIQEVISQWSSQQAGDSIVAAIQMTYLVALGITTIGVLMARPGLIKAMGFGGLGFLMAIVVIGAVGYIFIGSLLGGG